MAKLSSLRASDSDREQVAERLQCATAEGRLSAKELEERLDVLFAARTRGELDALLADLSPRRQRVLAARCAGAVSGTLLLALLGTLATRRRHSGAAPLAVAPHRGSLRLPDPAVAPHHRVTVSASMVRLSYGFAGMGRTTLGVDVLDRRIRRLNGAGAALKPARPVPAQALLSRELRPDRAVAARFVETDFLQRPTASRLVS